MKSYVNIHESDIGNGIDQESPLPNIRSGYFVEANNVDVLSTGGLTKRKGFEVVGGALPIPVLRAKQTGTDLCLRVPFTMDVSKLNNRPILVRGRTSVSSPPVNSEFTNTQDEILYGEFTTSIEKVLNVGPNTIVVDEEEHQKSAQHILPLLFENVGPNRSNSSVMVDSLEIDSSNEVTISYDNQGAATSAYVGYLDFSGNYVSDPSDFLGINGAQSLTITAATHGLSTSNLIVCLWEIIGGTYHVVIPDEATIEPNGDVVIDVVTDTSTDFLVGLYDVGNSSAVSGEILAGNTGSVTIETNFPFNHVNCYIEPTIGGDISQVIPNSVSWDNGVLSVELVNETSSTVRFFVFWKEVIIETSEICVTAAASATWEDITPDMVIYGLLSDGTSLVGSTANERALWVNWLDTYSSEGDKRPVASLFGRAMTLQNDDFISLYPRLISRISADTTIGPVFGEDTGATLNHRMLVDLTSEGFLSVNSIEWQSSTTIKVTCHAPGVVSVTPPVAGEDTLTIEGSRWSVNDGTFEITQFTVEDANTVSFLISNPSREDDCWDEIETGAVANCLSAKVPVTTTDIFVEGDLLGWEGNIDPSLTVREQDGLFVYIDNARVLETLPGGRRIHAKRALAVLPLRDLDDTATTGNLVAGDSIQIEGESRSIRIKDVYGFSDMSFTSSYDSINERLTVTVSDTSHLREGGVVSLFGELNGEFPIESILTTTTFTLSIELTGTTYSGKVRGKAVVIDESLSKEWTAFLSIDRPQRWFPIPRTSYEELPSSLTFENNEPDSQEIVRSTMSKDSLFMTNKVDAILKYDGIATSRAGLPRWQADMFLRADTSGTTIPINSVSAPYTSYTGSRVTLTTPAEVDNFVLGQEVVFVDVPSVTYTIQSLNATSGVITLDKQVSSSPAASGTIRGIHRVAYYARVNLTDANGILVSSAVVGENDLSIVLTADSAVELKFLNFPKLDSYAYDLLTLSIFRTKSTSPAGPYYELANIPLSGVGSYVSFRDTTVDAALTKLDALSSVLEGVELGTRWEGPLRSSHINAVGGRLVLANCQGWPIVDLLLSRGSNAPITAGTGMTGTVTIREDNTATGGQVFEFLGTGDTANTITAGVTSPTLSASTYYYVFKVSTTGELGGAGWHLTDGSGNIDASVNGSYRVIKATLATSIPIYVNGPADSASIIDTNWPRQELLSAEGRATQRLSAAINWWQSTLDVAWLTTQAGGSFERGQIRFIQPKVSSTIFEIELAGLNTSLSTFANGLGYGNSYPIQLSAFTDKFSSRILVSEENFPDLFNEPQVLIDKNSRNVVDVNPDDGQEVTGLSSFFGMATTSASQKQRTLIVFKESSIYALDVDTLTYQKLETEGKGCTLPGSIISTRDGIQFTNDSGLYRIGQDFKVTYVGRKYERLWKSPDSVIENGVASYWKFQNKIIMTHLLDGADQWAVFHTTRELETGAPALTTYSGLDSLMFSNYNNYLMFASRRGVVLQSRLSGTETDFRDEANTIPVKVVTRPHHFDEPLIRKTVRSFTSVFSYPEFGWSDVEVSTRVDIGGSMEPIDSIRLAQLPAFLQPNSYVNIVSSPSQGRGSYFQIQWTTDELDKGFELASYGMAVAGLTTSGTIEASDTTS